MSGSLDVHLNRDGPHSIEAESTPFETAGSFDVVLRNHGAALHVHLRLDADLGRVASVPEANHYVEEWRIVPVRIEVEERHLPVEGRLEVVTGYGTETAYVPVSIREPGEADDTVAVDERLAEPPGRRRDADPDPRTIPVIALGSVAALVAVAAIVLVEDPLVLLGIVVVLVGIVVAAGLARSHND